MEYVIDKKDYLEYLKNRVELYTNNKGQLIYSEDYGPNDKLSPEVMMEIIENKESDTSIETETLWHLEENGYLNYRNVFDQITYDYAMSKGFDYYDTEEELDDLLDEYVEYDFDIVKLLSNSRPSDFYITFGDNWDDEYYEMEKWNECKSDIEDDELTEDDVNEILSKTYLGWLLTTQGYKPYDVFRNHEKQLRNEFLNQVYLELFEYKTILTGMQLTASLESSDWDAITAIHERKPFVIKKDSAFGLFDTAYGCGCDFGIRLERDIVVENMDYEYGIVESKTPYNYSPAHVYGVTPSNGDENISLV